MGGEPKRIPLRELCDPSRGITYGIVKVGDFVPGGVPVIRGGDIREGKIVFDDHKRVTEEVSNQFERTILRGGEIVINLIAEPGHTAIVPPSLVGANVSRDVGVIALGEGVNHRYVDYCLKSPDAVRWLTSRLQGSVTQKINLGTLRELPIPIPARSDQESIARILGALDDKIEMNRKMNATLEAMARALFKSWFVDFDPVRAKAEGRAPSGMDAETAKLFPSEFVESELGDLPKGWSAVPVYDIATYVNGAAYKAFEPNDERRGLPIIKIAELKAGVTPQTKFSEVAMPEKYRLRTGDILFSWSGNPDTSIDTFIWAHGEAWLNQHIFRVDLHSPDERSFVLATLKYLRPVFAEIARNKQTTGLGHVTAGDMKRLLVVKPNVRVLAAWDRVAAPIFAATFRNELESITLARIRDELLPRLLSGALDVAPIADARGAT